MSRNIEVIDITPEIAESWLGRNTHNRTIRQRVVDAYAHDMTNGDWVWNGEGIKFDVDGVLLDGQHRLLAIVQSGATIPMPVFRGLPRQTQETMDGGAKRKFSDVLKLRGEDNYVALAAIIRLVYGWESGARRTLRDPSTSTNAQLLQTLEKHPELRSIAQEANRIAAHCALPASVIGFAWWLFEQVPDATEEDVSHFFNRLTEDTGHQKGEPVYELRRAAAASKDVRGERNRAYLIAITIKAWNAYRDHGNAPGVVGLLTWRPGGARPEKFPEPR